MPNPLRTTHRRVKKLVSFAPCLGFLLAAGLIPGTPAAGGQDTVVRAQKPLQHEVTVGLKLIQVYVTDKKGKPVTDLRREEFTVFDNGRPMTISDFERHVLAPATKAPAPAADAAAAPVTKPVAEAAPEKPDLGRKFFLFIDFAFNSPRGAMMAKQAALTFLDKNTVEGDEVGLISYSVTNGLAIHEFLTPERAKVRQALEDLNVRAGAGRADDVEQEYWRLAAEGGAAPDLSHDLGVRRQDAKSQARAFILKLTALAIAFRYVPGNKNLLLFSTGIASTLIYGGQAGTPVGSSGKTDRSTFELPDRVLTTEYESLFRELSASNCSIFSFDTREMAKPATLFDYDEQTFGSKTSRDIFTVGGASQTTNLVFKDEGITGKYSLTKLSNETGGRYFGNIKEAESNLADLREITGSYYVLGYSVGQSWDGAFHEVKVEVTRQGLDVRTQKGFFNPKPFTEYTDLEKTLHLLDLALNESPIYQSPLLGSLQALVGPGEPGSGKDRVVVLTRLPDTAADLLTGAKAEIVTFIFDGEENLADMRRAEERLSGFRDKPIIYASSASLPPGAYTCRVVVRDLETGTAAVASGAVLVPNPMASGIRLHTPLLLGPPAGSVFLEGRLTTLPGAPPAASWAALYPFSPVTHEPLLQPLAGDAPVVRVVLPMTVVNLEGSRIAFRAALLNTATAERYGASIVPVGRAAEGGAIIQTLDITTRGMSPGRYMVYFYAEDTASGALAHVAAPLVIR